MAIDDPSIRLLAASRHFGDEDPVRISVMLSRQADRAAVEYAESCGIARSYEHVHIPGRAELACAPEYVSGQTALASVDVVWPQEGSPSADAQAPLSAAVEEACRVEPAGRTLVQVRPRRALVLYAAAASANAVQQSLATLAGRALRTLEATTDSACRAVAGVGSVEAGLDGCPISYRHARGAGAPAMRVRVPRGCAAGHMAARRAASWLACTGGG